MGSAILPASAPLGRARRRRAGRRRDVDLVGGGHRIAGTGEFLAGFISIGTIAEPPPEVARPLSQTVWSCWAPGNTATPRRHLIAWQVNDEAIG